MKKVLCVVLSILMLSTLAGGAFAENPGEGWYDLDCSEAGVTLMVPESFFFGPQGVVDVLISEELGYKSGVYYTYLGYIAASEDDYYNGNAGDDCYAPIVQIIGMKDRFDNNAFAASGLEVDVSKAFELGSTDGVTFYAIIGTDTLPAGIRSPFAEEYYNLVNYAEDIINNSEYYAPVNPYADQDGVTAAFQTRDLNGNPVSSTELFSQNEITMVNLWATWCPHCCEELPQLARIHQQLQSLGCGIVGMLEDGYDPDAVEEAKQLLAEAGVTYPCVVSPENLDDMVSVRGLPLSFFVNRDGVMVGSPVEGAQVDKYYEAVQDLLNGGTTSDIVTDAPGEKLVAPAYSTSVNAGFHGIDGNSGKNQAVASFGKNQAGISPAGNVYRVICVDESGNPVAGAAVKFCSDDTCMMNKTDENGIAAFDTDPGHYTVHLLKPPAGYAKDSTEYEAPDTYGDVTIVLKAA